MLKTDDVGEVPVYCHMTSIGACGGGGWTLVMKIDGHKVINTIIHYQVKPLHVNPVLSGFF